MQKNKPPDFLRVTALLLSVCGALGSLSLTLYNGRNNKSFILVSIFAVWVLAPFVWLVWANMAAKNRVYGSVPAIIQAVVVTVGCLVAYSGLLSPQGAKLTGIFLVAPAAAWIVIFVAGTAFKK